MTEDTRPDTAKRLEQARLARGFATQKDATNYFGWKYVTYTQHESGDRGITRAAETYAKAFKVSPGWLLTGEGKGPTQQPMVVVPDAEDRPTVRPTPNASFPPRYQSFASDQSIPLLGQSTAGPNGRFVLNGKEVGRVFCPPGLEGVEGAYAVRVFGTSMEPRYMAGETVWLNPQEPVRANDDVVAQILQDSDEESPESYIKQFISRSSKVLRLRQHNPEEGESKELEFDNERVFSVHKIVFHATV